MHRNAKAAIALIVTLGVVFIFALTEFMEAHPLVDEFSDAVLMLDKTIDEAVFYKAAHPAFTADLQEIANDLRELPIPLESLLMSAANRRNESWSKTQIPMNRLMDRYDDTVAMLEDAIRKADDNKRADPKFLTDLKSILTDLRTQPRYWNVHETVVEEPKAGLVEKAADQSPEKKAVEMEAEDDSLLGSIQKVIEGVSELPGLFNEIGDLFRGGKSQPQVDAPDESAPQQKSLSQEKKESEKQQASPEEKAIVSEKTEPAEQPVTERPPVDDDEQISLDYLNRSNARIAVLESYAELGAEGVEKIIPFLEDEDSWVVSRAINALEKIGPAAAPAVPGLVLRLHDESLKLSILEALVAIDQELDQDAYCLLVPVLGDSSGYGIRQGRIILVKGGEKAVPALIAGLESGNEKPKMNVLPFWPP